jgi:hypothetical protein
MILIVPEAGGDAGVGCVRMAAGCSPGPSGAPAIERVHAWDASRELPLAGLLPPATLLTIGVVPLATAHEALAQALDTELTALAASGRPLVLAPTSEHMTGVLLALAAAGRLPRSLRSWLPSVDGYAASRDKVRLARHLEAVGLGHVAVETGGWSEARTFGKPRDGVGSRGCARVQTSAEAERLAATGHVFQPLLPGPDYVVDVAAGRALTRVVARQRGGADTQFVYVAEPALEAIARDIAASLGARVANVQAKKVGDGWRVFDVGTRFSGAACAARLAGVNWLAGLLSEGEGESSVAWFAPRYGTIVQRRFEEVTVTP